MTEKIVNVYQRLQKARVELQNKKLKKSGKNSYAGFTYYELKDFIPSVNELFDKHGLSSNFSIKENTAYLFIVNTDKPEEVILFESPVAEAQLRGCTAIQALGAVHTYMKRYLYLNALEIVEDDMLDPQVGKKPEAQNKQENLLNTLLTKFKAHKLTNEQITDFCKLYNINSKIEKTIEEFFKLYNADKLIKEYLQRKAKGGETNALSDTPLGKEVVNG